MRRLPLIILCLSLLMLVGVYVSRKVPVEWPEAWLSPLQVYSEQPATFREPVWRIRFSVFESTVFELKNGAGSPAGIGYVMEMASDSSLRVLRTFPATFGSRPGMKEAEGDRRSPHGRYYVTRIREKADRVNVYGGLFLDLNYPNPDDATSGRTGSGIGIHGGRMLPTRGCIRILDDNWEPGMTNIAEYAALVGDSSAVLVVRRLREDLRGRDSTLLAPAAWKTYYDLLRAESAGRETVLERLEAAGTTGT